MKTNPFKLAPIVPLKLERFTMTGGTLGTQAEDTVRHLNIAATLQVGLKRRHSPGGIKRVNSHMAGLK